METWVIYALLSMFFAGLTSILAKYGLQHIHPDLGLGIRTATIFLLVTGFDLATDKFKGLVAVTQKEWLLLILSGLATTLSWFFYYRAMKDGLLSYVAAIDKGSIIITLVLSFILFREPMNAKILAGAGLIFLGMIVLIWK
jgi:bacterial/archaeal transporter family protein